MTDIFLNEELCRKIISEVGDAVIFSDRQGNIRLWNRGAERIFGHSTEEALGRSLDIIIPENLRKRHWEGYFRVMGNGSSRYGTGLLSTPAIRKDGTFISIEFSIVLIKEDDAVISGIAAIIRDVSAGMRRESAMKQPILELEAQQTG